MQIITNVSNNQKSRITIVCCLHGDEVFGLDIFESYKAHLNEYPNMKLVLANELAIQNGVRFVDQDLNRSFPGSRIGNYETTLATEILNAIGETEYLLDIHTTTSDIVFTPILSYVTQQTLRIVNLSTSEEVVVMSPLFAAHSLIGQFKCGVSLEFNEQYARFASALTEVHRIVDGIYGDVVQEPRARRLFHVNKKISKGVILPDGIKNFVYSQQLVGYPFLLGEKGYADFQGFLGEEVEEIAI